jgi:hypothetical protein
MGKANNLIGAWAFLVGVLLAVIIGLADLSSEVWTAVLLLLGLVIGILNVGGKELKEFMLAGTVLIIVAALGGQALLTFQINVVNIGAVFSALIALFVPATIVVALKVVFALAKN